MNISQDRQSFLKRLVPPVAAIVFLFTFLWLGFWQLDRAAYKKQLAASFAGSDAYSRVFGEMPVNAFQPINSVGHYLDERQFLIENIVKEGQLGVYVITPFEFAADEALLIVNRGWLPRPPGQSPLPNIAVENRQQEIRGKAGNLPRVGIRPGEAFAGSSSWPRLGVYPTLDELSAELGRDVLPFVLLLDPEEGAPMLRQWQPVQSGPATHYGYAFQWFALALTVVVVSIWQLRKGRGSGNRKT